MEGIQFDSHLHLGPAHGTTSNASIKIQIFVESGFLPITWMLNVWVPAVRPLIEKTVGWGCSVGKYGSNSSTNAPSRNMRAIPVWGPRAPTQLTPVPVKVNVACAPGVVDIRAAPALHARSEAPCVRPVVTPGMNVTTGLS